MAVTQYVGSRYVPLFADPIDWSDQNTYEPLTIVLYQGASYTSRQAVPKGISIDNEDFWAITGNYNAQVEQYRRETAAAKAAADAAQESAENALAVANAAQASADAAQTSADAAQASADAAQASADAAQASADAAQIEAESAKTYAENLNYQDAIKLNFFGRIFNEVNTLESQGMCVVNDALGYAVFGQDANASDHSAVVYKFNPKTGTVIEHFNRDLYHCNDMCYNANDGYVYVARLTNTTDTVLIKCAASTLNIIDTIDTGIPVFGCAYDKVTDKMYIYSKSSGTFHVYEFDPQTLDKAEVFSVSDDELGYGVGTQGLIAYDGTVSIILSSDSICQLVTKRDGMLLTRNVSNTCYIYTAYEWQSGDYLADGTLFVNSIAWALNKLCMCIGTFKDGSAIDQHYDLSMIKRAVVNCYLIPNSINANIKPSGAYDAAFATFDEAMRYVELTGARLFLEGSGNIPVDYAYVIPFDFTIYGSANARLLVTTGLNFFGRVTLLNVNLDYVHPGTGYMITARNDVFMQGVKVKCLASSSGNRFMGLFTKCTLNNCTYENETSYESYVMDGNGTCLFVANAGTTGFNYYGKGSVL